MTKPACIQVSPRQPRPRGLLMALFDFPRPGLILSTIEAVYVFSIAMTSPFVRDRTPAAPAPRRSYPLLRHQEAAHQDVTRTAFPVRVHRLWIRDSVGWRLGSRSPCTLGSVSLLLWQLCDVLLGGAAELLHVVMTCAGHGV